MTDNAWAYRYSLREVCAALHARQIFIKPRCPWQNGKVERLDNNPRPCALPSVAQCVNCFANKLITVDPPSAVSLEEVGQERFLSVVLPPNVSGAGRSGG